MKVVPGAAGALAALFLLAWFASVHFSQRVTLQFGIVTLRNVPLPFALYGAVTLGMLVMIFVGLRTDLRTRNLLRRYRAMADLPQSRGARSPEGEGGAEGGAEALGEGARFEPEEPTYRKTPD